MQESPLIAKSKIFVLEIIRVCNEIKTKKEESVLTNQLIRLGTSVGANIREAFYAHGKAGVKSYNEGNSAGQIVLDVFIGAEGWVSNS